MSRLLVLLFVMLLFLPQALSAAENASREWKSQKSPTELNEDALRFFQSGQWEKAVDNFTRAIDQEPNNLAIRYNLALMYYKLQRYVLARDEAIRILRRNPRHRNAVSLYVDSIKGIRSTPGAEDPDLIGRLPDFMTPDGEMRSERTPAAVLDLLKANYVQQDFNFVWENLAGEVQALTPKQAFVRNSSISYQNEMKGSRALELEIEFFESKGPYAVAMYLLHLENPSTAELKEILGGEEKYRVRVRNYMFFLQEQDRWKMYPISVFGKNLAEFYRRFPGLYRQTGAEIQWKAVWFDRNHFFLERFEQMWKRREPARSVQAAIMRTVYEYLNSLKQGKADEAVKHLSSFSRNRFTAVKLSELPLYRNMYQLEIGAAQHSGQTALCEFRVENLEISPSGEEIRLTRLSSSLVLVYEDGFWKIIEHAQKPEFLERRGGELGEIRVGDEQFSYFNGRDWIDASLEYRRGQTGPGKK